MTDAQVKELEARVKRLEAELQAARAALVDAYIALRSERERRGPAGRCDCTNGTIVIAGVEEDCDRCDGHGNLPIT